MRSLALLGSTGSIGTQTLDRVRTGAGRFRAAALVANSNWRALVEQAREFQPDVVGLVDPEAGERAREELPSSIALRTGADALEEIAAEVRCDLAVHGVVGAAGVRSSAHFLGRGIPLALANKESLVVAGAELMELSRSKGAPILPVDSEHCAIFQCLANESIDRVRRIWLTASGGAFRDIPLDELADVRPEEALSHPNWSMGKRITVGSATLMNKALEVIEAHHLYGLEADRIRVVLHRQSIVHSMVEFVDGSVLAQLGPPDMRMPIQFALNWPERVPSELIGFDPVSMSRLDFAEVDQERFPALELGYRAVREGSDAGCALNAADEVAVEAFLAGRIGFQDITPINRSVVDSRPGLDQSIEDLLTSDAQARERTLQAIDHLCAAADGQA